MTGGRWLRGLLAGVPALLVVLALVYWALLGTTSVRPLARGAYLLTTSGPLGAIGANVVAVRGDSGVVLVDTQLRPLAVRIRSVVREHVGGGPITHVVISHWHPDHSGGVGVFSRQASVVAHSSVKRRLAAPQEAFGLTAPDSHHEFPARGQDELPQVTYDTTHTIELGGRRARLEHVPAAHTDGDTIVFFPELNIVAVGDLVWPGAFPYIDTHNGGSAAGLEAALARLIRRVDDEVVIVPGHGAPIGKAELVRYHQMVSDSVAWAREDAAGEPPEEWSDWESDLVPASAWQRMLGAAR